MTRASEWLDGYKKAWNTKDAGDVAAIFTDDAVYWFPPDDADPAQGIDAIVDMWEDGEPTDPVHDLYVLVENDDVGIIRGSVSYPGYETYVNLWEVHFAPDGRARKFVEWSRPQYRGPAPSTDDD